MLQTYDVVFNSNENSNCKGFRATKVRCIAYIKKLNGTNISYFADYKGGTVSVVSNETGETIYSKLVK